MNGSPDLMASALVSASTLQRICLLSSTTSACVHFHRESLLVSTAKSFATCSISHAGLGA